MTAELTQLISTVGFPIAVASYTLITLNKTIQKNTTIVQENTSLLKRVIAKLDIKEIEKED